MSLGFHCDRFKSRAQGENWKNHRKHNNNRSWTAINAPMPPMDKQNNEIAFYRLRHWDIRDSRETRNKKNQESRIFFLAVCFFRLSNGIELEKLASERKKIREIYTAAERQYNTIYRKENERNGYLMRFSWHHLNIYIFKFNFNAVW